MRALPDAPVTADLAIDQTGHDYGDVTVLVPSAPFTVTVTNPTTIEVGPLAATLTGDASFAIASTTCDGATLIGGASCTTAIVFTPTAAGSRTATLTIAAGNVAVTVSFTGVGTALSAVAVDDTLTLLEDAAATPLDVRANDAGAENTTIDAVTQGAKGTVAIEGTRVVYTPNANANGSDTFTYALSGGSIGTVNVAIDAVNDAPSFVGGADISVADNSGAHAITGWATQISFGPPDEASQFAVSTPTSYDNVDLFTVGPSFNSVTGSIEFEVAPNMTGVATVQTQIIDSGGTANGGVSFSNVHTFTISVVDNDVPPTAVDDTVTVDQNGAEQTIEVLANDTNTDGGPMMVDSVTQPVAGTGAVTFTATSVQYTPPAGYCNTVTGVPAMFTYTLSPGSDTATIRVNVRCTDSRLASLTVTNGGTPLALSPAFASGTTSYALPAVGLTGGALSITASAIDPAATIQIQSSTPVQGPLTRTANIAMGANTISIIVRRTGQPDRTYMLSVTRTTAVAHQAYVKATTPGPSVQDFYGGSVAISGDTLVVGSSQEDGVGEALFNTGAVYVYTRSGSTWTLQQVLRASNAQAGDNFGDHVAIDGNTLVVGASSEMSSATTVNGNEANNSNPSQGAAYVFVRSGTTWTQQAYLKASNGQREDFFGIGLAVSGDTIAVGAQGEDSLTGAESDNSALNAGAVYIFQRTGTTWAQQAYIKASAPNTDDLFGFRLDLDANTLVVGAMGEDGGTSDPTDNSRMSSGAAYVFVRSGTTWTQEAYLKASIIDDFASFGSDVAVSGDTIAVASIDDDSGAVEGDEAIGDAGAVHVFVRSGSTWTRQAFLQAPQKSANDDFGWSIALDGNALVVGMRDEDGDGVGVNPVANEGRSTSGAAYAFYRTGTRWDFHAYVKAPNPDVNDWLGYAIDVQGNTCVVAAVGESSDGSSPTNNSTSYAGAVYVLTGVQP